jgi:hypothetical protein
MYVCPRTEFNQNSKLKKRKVDGALFAKRRLAQYIFCRHYRVKNEENGPKLHLQPLNKVQLSPSALTGNSHFALQISVTISYTKFHENQTEIYPMTP